MDKRSLLVCSQMILVKLQNDFSVSDTVKLSHKILLSLAYILFNRRETLGVWPILGTDYDSFNI